MYKRQLRDDGVGEVQVDSADGVVQSEIIQNPTAGAPDKLAHERSFVLPHLRLSPWLEMHLENRLPFLAGEKEHDAQDLSLIHISSSMSKSMRITSGCSSRASRTAALPEAASPTTSRSSSVSR